VANLGIIPKKLTGILINPVGYWIGAIQADNQFWSVKGIWLVFGWIWWKIKKFPNYKAG